MIIRVALGTAINPALFWLSLLLIVPVIVAPVTYKSLVGGGCSLRFHICPLVKGIIAGLVMYFMALAADFAIGLLLGGNQTWSLLYGTTVIRDPNQIWWFSGLAGGIMARIAEVRGV